MESKTVLLTGACGGIGQHISETLLRDGYSIIALGTNSQRLRKLQEKQKRLGNIEVDVLNLASEEAIIEYAHSSSSIIYGIINNAGICIPEFIHDEKDIQQSLSHWEEVININVRAPFLLTKLLLPRLSRPGRIVNISSQLGIEGRAGYGSYSASKFALIGLTKCWAKELGEQAITVNAICPGWVETQQAINDLARLAKNRGVSTEEYYENVCSPLELKRFTLPEEIAYLVSYLLSSRGKGITGRDWLLNTIWNQE